MYKKLTFDVLVDGKSQTIKPATTELGVVETEVVKVVLEQLQPMLAGSNAEIIFSEEEIIE